MRAFLDAERHKFWERHDSSALWAREMPKNQTQKDTNFGNAMILWHFGPEKCQKSAPERHEFRECNNSLLPWARESPNPTAKDTNFGKTALIDPSKNANKIRKVFIFPEFRTLFEMHSLTPSTLTKQPLGNT